MKDQISRDDALTVRFESSFLGGMDKHRVGLSLASNVQSSVVGRVAVGAVLVSRAG